MSESRDYKKLKSVLVGPEDRMDRIENLMVSGMPDINFCSQGVECWIELKSPIEPKKPNTLLFGSHRYGLSIAQRNWLLRQTQAGGNAYVLIATDKRWLLIDGKDADIINTLPIRNLIMDYALWRADHPITAIQWYELKGVLQEKKAVKTSQIAWA